MLKIANNDIKIYFTDTNIRGNYPCYGDFLTVCFPVSDDDDVTVFVPNNGAFQKLSAETHAYLNNHPSVIQGNTCLTKPNLSLL